MDSLGINFGKQAMKLYENDVETQIVLAQASLALIGNPYGSACSCDFHRR